MARLLLDTNILVAIIRDSKFEDFFQKNYPAEENDFAISIVVHGEIQSLALQWDWKEQKTKALKHILDTLIVIPIEVKSIIDAYANIDAYSQGKLKSNQLPKGISSRNMGKNDLWIAATAYVSKATLLTLDKDFDHLARVFLDLKKLEINV